MSETLSAKSPQIVMALLVLAIFVLLAFGVPRLLRRVLRRAGLPAEARSVMERIVFLAFLFLGFFAALSELDISLGALGIEVSLLGVAVGFALKDLLTNLVSGLIILSSRPFVIGDQIRIKEFEGTVNAIGLRGTTLVTYDGRHVIIPNIDLFTNPVTNNTASPLRRHSIHVGVSSQSNLPRVQEIILGALDQMAEVAADPAPDVLVAQLADFDIKLEIRIWTAAVQSEMKRINSEATKAIREALIANKVDMPLPKQVVQVLMPAPAIADD